MSESPVYLKKTSTGQLVDAILWDEITDEHLKMWKDSWQPLMQSYCAGQPLGNKPEDHHWDWEWKAPQWRSLLEYHSYAITCEGGLQGLMLLSDLKSARLQSQFGKPIVYVSFLSTAPWNRPQIERPVRYRGVGTVMVAAAVELSASLGFQSRIGLHALPGAERFYREACGMSELGTDAAHQGLIYYEMTENQAELFRR